METENSSGAELSHQKNRDALLKKIATLKTYVSTLEGSIGAPASRRPQLKKNIYAIEILIDGNGYGKLGKCVLPYFIDVHNILSQYPIDNLNNVKHFLKSCRHHVDYYFSRRKQVEELKNLLSKIQNSCVYNHNEDVTLVELTMYNVKDVCTYDTYDVAICLHYYSDETRPYKLYTSTNDVVARSLSFYRRLNTYFVPFLKKDLSPAFMQIINSYGEFIWQKVMTANEDDTEIYEEKVCESEEGDGYVDQFLCRRDRSLKLRASEVQLRISSDKIEMEVDSVERDGRRDKISGRSTTGKE